MSEFVISEQSLHSFYMAISGASVPKGLVIYAFQGVRFIRPIKGVLEVRVGPDQIDKYDDLVIVAGSLGAGRILEAFKATTQPGRYFTQTDPHPLGAANLTYGIHSYTKGNHPAVTGYPALRSANEINRIWRDSDGNHRFGPMERVHEGVFGINIHAGGSGEQVGRWSAGCIAIHGGVNQSPWKKFIGLSYDHIDKSRTPIRVLHWRGTDYFRFVRTIDPRSFMPTLYPGSEAQQVRILAKKLREVGIYQGEIPSWYVNDLIPAVTAFQAQKDLFPDAIVGPKTWSSLLGVPLASLGG